MESEGHTYMVATPHHRDNHSVHTKSPHTTPQGQPQRAHQITSHHTTGTTTACTPNHLRNWISCLV